MTLVGVVLRHSFILRKFDQLFLVFLLGILDTRTILVSKRDHKYIRYYVRWADQKADA